MGVRGGLMRASIDLPFADGTYRFRLGLAQIAELQRKCEAGLGRIFARVLAGRYGSQAAHFGHPLEADYDYVHLVEVVRQGLIGGRQGEVDGQPVEVSAIVANRLIDAYALEMDVKELWSLAASILADRIEGYEEPAPKKAAPAAAPATATTDGSTMPEPSPTAP